MASVSRARRSRLAIFFQDRTADFPEGGTGQLAVQSHEATRDAGKLLEGFPAEVFGTLQPIVDCVILTPRRGGNVAAQPDFPHRKLPE